MPTSRKKSCKKTVSIVDTTLVSITPAETPPDPCPLCGRGSAPTEPAAEPAVTAVTAETLSQDIEAAFDELPVQLPPSVRKKISARLLKGGVHPSTPEGVEIVKTACQAYLAKKEKARTASAARRAAKKEADMQPEAADQQADVTP